MTDEPARGRRVLLGEISGAHGIRGDLIVRSYAADPSGIAAYGALETAQGKVLPKLSIVRVTDRGVIARFSGVTDRNAAEALKGTQLWVARDRLPKAADGEYYHADLIGLDAVAPDGTEIGHVIAVENFGAGDLLEIRMKDSKRTEYVPFTNAAVPEVDVAAGRLVVVMPDVLDDEDGDEGEDGEEAEGGQEIEPQT
ncbi:MAG: ribosome maturation factor RimM [Hyphomicrobiaceae bacterium]